MDLHSSSSDMPDNLLDLSGSSGQDETPLHPRQTFRQRDMAQTDLASGNLSPSKGHAIASIQRTNQTECGQRSSLRITNTSQ